MFCFAWCCPDRYQRVDGHDRRPRHARNLQEDNGGESDDTLRKTAIPSNELEIMERISTKLGEDNRRISSDWAMASNEEIDAHIKNSFSSLLSEPMKYDAVSTLLILEGKRMRRKGKKEIHEFVRLSASLLNEKQQDELVDVLSGLPPAVLGDSEDKEATRVLVDLTSDIRSALTDVRHYHHETDKVKSAIERLEPLVKTESVHSKLIPKLLESLSDHDRLRIVMMQLFLAHLIPSNREDRRTLFAYMFRNVSLVEKPKLSENLESF
jgi:hypothetical protein